MFSLKKGIWIFFIFTMAYSVLPASAEFRTVHKFTRVTIPFDMKHDDALLKKGAYDFEICADRSVSLWILRIIRKGKILCALTGEVLRDQAPGAYGEKMAGVPDEPTLKVKRIPEEKIAHITFENAGIEAGAEVFPYYVVRFKISYEQE
jgi:hypothetical protein